MNGTYLEVTYCRGRVFAAYFYLSRKDGDRSARCERAEHGMVVDFAPDGRPIGIEITAPGSVTLERVNRVLGRLEHAPLDEQEFAPLVAA